MIRKRGKMGQPVKNGTRYEKCTLAISVFFQNSPFCFNFCNYITNVEKEKPGASVTYNYIEEKIRWFISRLLWRKTKLMISEIWLKN